MLDTLDTLPLIVRMLVSLVLVIGLMGGLALLIQRLGLTHNLPLNTDKKPTITITERKQIDPRRQLIVIEREGEEHFILLGANNETVIRSRHIGAATDNPDNKDT